jgi:hypothetical protein
MDLVQGAQAFQILAAHLKEAGEGGLRRELQKKIRDAADPIADDIDALANLKVHMPDRYAAVLAKDLQVTTHARAGGTSPGVTIMARAPTLGGGGRKVRQREEGIITHPAWPGGRPRKEWKWKVQTAGMKPGFFTGPAEKAVPQVRDAVLAAMRDVTDKITRRT